ncbi:taste receptor type 2 member 39-like [Zootoca vivipara]|uniref:taste receptor type 2 member 39-like n=1 Tax=Zootoca vivipara TaxID=8524 RepID=UPI00293C02BA|nr:taste receptor type 2 member 39-like [Zootoca vivipara]
MQNTSYNLFQEDAFLQMQISIPSYSTWTFVNIAELWFATWLSVLYCVKIANFSHPLFLQMKWRFPGLVPWLLLGTVVFSAITTIVALTGSSIMSKCNIFAPILSNGSDSGMKTSHSCRYVFLFFLLPNLFPFVIFFSSSILLLTSLWRHKNLLRNSARDVSTEAHLNAIKALASFCILYIAHLCVEILDTFMFWGDIKCIWIYLIVFNVIAAYSSGHTVILIFINPKLKQESMRLLHRLKC